MTLKDDLKTKQKRAFLWAIGFTLIIIGMYGLANPAEIPQYIGNHLSDTAYGAILFTGIIIFFSRHYIE